ncbi:MAG: hypothetical protein U0Z75_06530 [Deinococcaceae bacterium]
MSYTRFSAWTLCACLLSSCSSWNPTAVNFNSQGITLPQYTLIKGSFVLLGKQPDGDSVRFLPDNPALILGLDNGSRAAFSPDGTVQLRFESIDAPELHYVGAGQPLGKYSRDLLLSKMGFKNLTYAADGMTVTGATPTTLRGAILSQQVEDYGRPVAYAMMDNNASAYLDGSSVNVGKTVLQKTLNYTMLNIGAAYLTVYSTTPSYHRDYLRDIARSARTLAKGIWPKDMTASFALVDTTSVGEGGQLILPKMFRRATDYFSDVKKGTFTGNLVDWLNANPDRNDRVSVSGGPDQKLSDLVEQKGSAVTFKVDLLDVVFVK